MFTWSNDYIWFSYYCSDGRCRTSVGISIKKEAYKKGAFPESDKVLLKSIESEALQHIRECDVLKRPLLKANLKNIVDVALGRIKSGSIFVEDWRRMMEEMRTGKLLTPRKKKRYSSGTIREYDINLNRLISFSDDAGVPLKYDAIDDEWLKRLNAWLVSENYSKGTIAYFSGKLKAFLRLMKERGRHYMESAESKQLKHEKPDENNAVVTYEDEIWKLYKLPLTRGKKRARDVYVFGCGVGLRVDDLSRINDYILVDNAFEFLTSKTGKKIQIPLHWLSKKIYEEYDGKLPVYKSSYGLGKHLPDICRLAELNEKKLVVETIGGVTKGEYYEKCDLVTPHTMRRSFATNAILNGIPDRQVMEITGHDSLESFKRYIVITQERNKQLLLNHPFFTGEAFLQTVNKVK